MKHLLSMLALSVLLALPVLAAEQAQLPPAEGQALKEYILKTNAYTTWKLMPGTEKLRVGPAGPSVSETHGAYLTTYVNDVAFSGMPLKGAFPSGSIIVKENYTQDKKLAFLTVMYKKEGYSVHHGDWMWLKCTPDGTVEAQGMVAACMQCHAKAMASDWVFNIKK